MDLRNRLFGSLFKRKEIPSPTNSDTDSEQQEDLESSTNTLKDYWMRDDKVKECYDCKAVFNVYRRKHHCRLCGQIFCNRCASQMVPGRRFGYQEDIRVCNFCLRLVGEYQDRRSEDGERLFRSASTSSLDPAHISLERQKKLLSPLFKEEKKKTNVPFRKSGMDEDEEAVEFTTYFTDDEMNAFAEQDNLVPKSFIKITQSAQELDQKPKPSGWKSPTFVPRRKFSSRFRFQSDIDLTNAKQFYSVSAALNVEINAASVNHVRLLMRQMLLSSQVEQIPEWENVILNLLLNVCNKISPDIRNGDEIDIRHYVKVKRIPGGLISDSLYINGVVATKKALHKKMLVPVDNPKILLVTFPIEFQRIEGQFISLDVLISQEREHLQHMTARMIRLKPDIIMADKPVARIAFELLLEANIKVIPNVKIDVLNAISRFTKTAIIHSIDKLSAHNLGTCDRFSFKTFSDPLIEGYRKSFLWIQGCPEQLGCTLVLRGADNATLKAIKGITDFLVFVVYSLKLETCLFQDQYALTPTIEPIPSAAELQGSTDLEKMNNAYKTTILSGSPNVQFPPPSYLLHRSILEGKPLTEMDATKPEDIDDGRLSFLQKFSVESIGPMAPFLQQQITVLYSSVSNASMIPCITPHHVMMEYYRDSDSTLGQFVEDLCFSSTFQCPTKNCDQTMLSHFKTYAHDTGKVIVTVDALPCPVEGMIDHILMWSLCKVCKEATPFIPMSEETWKYSFGKYLELTFYHSALRCRATTCTHDVHREHTRFFAFRNFTVRFEYEAIDLYSISGPPMRRRPKLETISKLRQQDMAILQKQIILYYDSILNRIQGFTYEIVATNRIPQCKEAMSELLKKATMEKKFMLQLLHQNMIESAANDYLALNSVYKTLLENITAWDTEFSNFIRVHLQSDARDLRRITASQIKRIFQDKETTYADHRNTIFAGGNDFTRVEEPELPVIEKSHLPVLNLKPDYEEVLFTPTTARRMSLELLESDAVLLPILGGSPKPKAVIQSPIASFSFDENAIPLRKLSMKSNNTESMDERNSSSIPRVLAFDEDEERSSSEGLMYPRQFFPRVRPKTIRIDSNNSQYSASNEHRLPLEDERTPEWNTITGVAGEVEREQLTAVTSEQRPKSIMQTITNIWNGNPANFLPLVYPSNAGEHIFPDSLIIVREEEPSSIVAFTLSSDFYKEKLKVMRSEAEFEKKPQEDTPYPKDDENVANVDEALLQDPNKHIHHLFGDGPTKIQCRVYFAEKFDALRRNCGINEYFEQSLTRCVKWDAGGGKSGAFFMKTRDDWLVVKKLSQIELEALVSFSPAYFEYMSKAFSEEFPTILAKIYGFFHISYKNPTSRKTVKMDILVMENLFHERTKISRIFDLKGSSRNRHVQSTGKQNEVLLDKNLLEFIYESPLFIREYCKKLLHSSVYNDTLFLANRNVMDYSLLVGIDNESKELVIGIVDFIRTFTWDKKLESWVKETGLLGGGKEPTIVTPRQYKNRFQDAMERYFLMVPEKFPLVVNTEK